MFRTLKVLFNLALLATCLKKRELVLTFNGKVWCEELSTYISGAEAYLAGVGKARKTSNERVFFNLLLVQAAEKEAMKWQRQLRNKNRRPQWDREKVLGLLVEIQERMSKGMCLIKAAEQKKATCSLKLQAARDGKHMNRKEWTQCVNGRDAWDKRISAMWDLWKGLQAESAKLAKEFGLWPEFFKLVDASFHRNGYDTCPLVRDKGLDFNEKPSGLTGEWDHDTIGNMADNHVAENAKLNAAFKAAEYGKRQKSLKSDTRPSYTKKQVNGKWVVQYRHTQATDQLLDWAKARRLERQRDAWRQDAKKNSFEVVNTFKEITQATPQMVEVVEEYNYIYE